MSIDLRNGVVLKVIPPGPAETVVVPVAGPRGDQGPMGPPGSADVQGAYAHTQSAPVLLVQVQHGLDFRPAGVVCVESDGALIEPESITWPAAGITEITFGVPFAGTVYVS